MFSAPFLAVGLLLSSAMTIASPAPIFDRDTAAFNPSQYNKPDAGTPSHYFAGNSSLPVKSLAKAATKGSNALKSYPLGGGGSKKVPIYGDWSDLDGVSRSMLEFIPKLISILGWCLLLDCRYGCRLRRHRLQVQG